MISISLDEHSQVPMYLQIYEYIKKEIWEGRLLYPERLPSSRSLSSFLQVSRSTVDTAYEQLVSEGYIESRERKGFFVCPMTHQKNFQINSYEKKDVKDISGFNDIYSQNLSNSKYDLNPDSIDTEHFPYSIWKSIGKNQLDNPKNFLASGPYGIWELRQAIAGYLHGSRGVTCTAENVIVGAGLDHLLQMLCVLLDRKAIIAMENPGYRSARQILKSGGCQVIDIALKNEVMDVEKLSSSAASICYVTPSHQFPLGSVMPVSSRQKLLLWASEKEDRYIIEDDHDSEFRYAGKPIPSLQSLDKNQKVLYIGTFSKAISPAIRTGYMVLPPRLLTTYREKCGFYACPVSRIQQAVLADFMSQGYFEKHLNRMRKHYKAKHDKILEELSPAIKQGLFKISGDYAGLYIILRYHGKKTESEIEKSAKQNGIVLRSLREYYTALSGDYVPAYLIGFGNLKETEIATVIKLLVTEVFE